MKFENDKSLFLTKNSKHTTMDDLITQIAELKTQLTGDLFQDLETQQKIYELKKQLNPEIVDHPELDEDDECLSCGS